MNKLKRSRRIEFIDTLAYYNKIGKFNGKLCLSSFVTYLSTIYMQSLFELSDDDFINTIKMIFLCIHSYCIGVKFVDLKNYKLAEKKIAMIEDVLSDKGIDVAFDKGFEIILKRTSDIRVDVLLKDKLFECNEKNIRYKDSELNLDVTNEIQNVLRK